MNWSRLAGSGTALLMGVAVLVANPSLAGAAGDLVVEESGDTVTYSDPALAREKTTTVEGTLRIAYVDRLDQAGRPESEFAYSVTTDDGDSVPIALAGELPTSVANGAIEADVVVGGSDDAQVAQATVETAPSAVAPTANAHRAYVVLVPKTGTLPSEATVTTRLENEVLDEWVTESDGAISAFTIEGSATLAASAPAGQNKATLCKLNAPHALWDEGVEEFPGVDFGTPGTPNHLIMITSERCSSVSSTGLGIGTLGQGIDDGGTSVVRWDDRYFDATAIHELGHNFGLGHANARSCETCPVDDYVDLFSVMGYATANNQAPALDTAYRDLLGITQPGEVDTVTTGSSTQATVTKTLQPRGSSSGLRALKVADPISGQEYWVENRAGGSVDRDAGATYVSRVQTVRTMVRGTWVDTNAYRFRPGVTVTQAGDENSIELIPLESGFTDDGAVQEGQTWTSPSTGVKVVVDSTAVGGPARVTVTTGAPRRLAGPDRYATAVEISKATFGSGVAAVFVANGLGFADGLSGGPGAAKLGGPLLLTQAGVLPGAVAREIARLNPQTVYILGGTGVVKPVVASQIEAITGDIPVRLGGGNRYETAAESAGLWRDDVGTDGLNTVYVASGTTFPDALSGGGAAARDDAPLLLTTPNVLPAETAKALQNLAPRRVVLIGGSGAVSVAVESAIAGVVPGAVIDRVGGEDRFATSALLLPGVADVDTVFVASGLDFPDALAGVPASAADGAVLALSRPACLPATVAGALNRAQIDQFVLVGGRAVINDSVTTTPCEPS